MMNIMILLKKIEFINKINVLHKYHFYSNNQFMINTKGFLFCFLKKF